jgi:hypothetical protein
LRPLVFRIHTRSEAEEIVVIETMEMPKTINFRQEPFNKTLIEEMLPLWRDHYEELALYKDFPLSPTLYVYENASMRSILRIYTAREEDRLVGYQVFFVHAHPHFSGAMEAIQDLLFLSQDMRKGFTGYRFLKWCDEQLTSDGVNLIFQHVNKDHDYGPLLRRLGYVAHDILYSKRVS